MIVRPPLTETDRNFQLIRNWPARVLLAAAVLLSAGQAFGQASVTLAWNKSSGSGVAGYRVFYGVASNTYTNQVDSGSATNATISGLRSGTTYFFAAASYSSNGLQSAYSPEVSYTTGSSGAPAVVLTSPASGSSYVSPATITLAATVSTNGHTINKVQFFNGAALLAEDAAAPYSFTWSGVSAGSYALSAKVVYDATNTLASAGVNVTVGAPAPAGLTFASTSGSLNAPFLASNGLVFQTTETGVTNGGRAAYTVSIPSAGNYQISAMVIAPNSGANSFYLNFDAEPTDPTMIWDVPVTSALTSQMVAWRGTGTDTSDQFSPKIFTLSQGTHQLIIRGREPNTQLGRITISPVSTTTTPPVVALTSPANGSTFLAPAALPLAATVAPNGHTITKVQFFNGSALLAEVATAPYTFAWNNVSAGNYTLLATAIYDSGSSVSSPGSSVAVTSPPASPASSQTFASTSGTLSGSYLTSNGAVYQTTTTGVTGGWRGVYTFTVGSTGDYLVSALVNAPNSLANSFYVNIDAEPTDPLTIWDLPVASGFVSQTVSWRGNGTTSSGSSGYTAQFAPKAFNLAQGTHQLIIRGREANTQLGSITVSPAPALPPPWQVIDIGAVAVTGSASVNAGVYTVAGAGAFGGTIDSLRFLYQSLSGDGEIRARLNSVQNTSASAQAGVIIRETLAPGSRYASVGLSPDGTIRTGNRSSTSGAASSVAAGTGTLPNVWARLVRSGNTFSSFSSSDGATWVPLSSISISMATNIYFGFAVISGQTNVLNTSSFSSTTVVP